MPQPKAKTEDDKRSDAQQAEIDQQKDAGREEEIEDAKKAATEGEADDDDLRGRSSIEIRNDPELREKAQKRAAERGAELTAARSNPDVTHRFAGGTPGGASESQQAGPGRTATIDLDERTALGVRPRVARPRNPSWDYPEGDEEKGNAADEKKDKGGGGEQARLDNRG
jgi:hypothetical protein